MLSNVEEAELNKMVDEKIELGDQLQKRFEPFIHIEGAIKIQKKISRELKYLEKVCCVWCLTHTVHLNIDCRVQLS